MAESDPAPVTDVTATDLIIDIAILLRSGLVAVTTDGPDEDLIPRFDLTARGRQECHHEGVTTGEVRP